MTIKATLSKCLIITTILSVIFSAFSPVSAASNKRFENCRIKKGFTENYSFENPKEKKYRIKIENKKIAKLSGKITTKNGKTLCKVKGLKKGGTIARIYFRKKLVGRFRIQVYSGDAVIKEKCKTINLKYNSHGSTAYMDGCNIRAKELIKHIHPKGKYTALSDDYSIVNHTNDGLIYTVNKGTTTLKIIETINGNNKTLGKITVNVKNAKMSYVAKENRKFYPEGIFGKGNKYECIYLSGQGKKLNIQSRIKSSLINNMYTGSYFKKSEYKIKYKSHNPKIAVVNKNGIIRGKKVGNTKIRFTIHFSDKSKFTGFCHISVQKR